MIDGRFDQHFAELFAASPAENRDVYRYCNQLRSNRTLSPRPLPGAPQ